MLAYAVHCLGLQVAELHALSRAMWPVDWIAKAFAERLIEAGFSELTAGSQTIFHSTYRNGDEEFRVGRQRSYFGVVYEHQQGSCIFNVINLLDSEIQVEQTRTSFVWEQPHGPGGDRAARITDMSDLSIFNFETIEELLNFLLALRIV